MMEKLPFKKIWEFVNNLMGKKVVVIKIFWGKWKKGFKLTTKIKQKVTR